jgi:hypothetical protein
MQPRQGSEQQVKPCKHCPHGVVLGGRGLWIHVNGQGFECRAEDGTKLYTFAEPVGWPMNPTGGFAGS